MSSIRTALLWAALLASPVLGDPDGDRLRGVLERRFLDGVPHTVKAAEAVGGGPLGFVVEVPVQREDADEAAHQRRMQTLQARLTGQALALLAQEFPERPVASWSTVDLVEATAPAPAVTPARPEPMAAVAPRRPRGRTTAGVPIEALDMLGATGGAIHGAPPAALFAAAPVSPRPMASPSLPPAPQVPRQPLEQAREPRPAPPALTRTGLAPAVGAPGVDAPAGDAPRVDPNGAALVGAQMASLAPSMADRLRRELAPLYPDARVEVIPRGPRKVEVWITILTQEPGDSNGPVIVDYVKRLTEIVCSRDFAGVEVIGGPNIGVRPLEDPDGDEWPRRGNGDWRSRQPRERLGLSRALEGRIRQELALRFKSVRADVAFAGPHEAVVEIRAETPGYLTPENRGAQREFLRRTVLTLLGNEHPDIKLSARSSFTVWTREKAPVPARPPRAAGGVSVSAPISALRAKVVELPTAHLLRPGKRQYEVGAFHREVKDGLFSNVANYGITGVELGYRQGLIRSVEGTLTYSSYRTDASVRDPATFVAGSTGQGVLTGGLKLMLLRRNGAELTLGGSQSLVSNLDRPHFLPDEWARFANAYLAVSAPFAPRWRATAVALRGFIPASGPSDSAAVTVLGTAIEFLVYEEVRLALEGVGERLSGSSVGELGAPLLVEGDPKYDNLHFNLSGTFGFHGVGDVTVYARKFNVSEQREFGASLFKRF